MFELTDQQNDRRIKLEHAIAYNEERINLNQDLPEVVKFSENQLKYLRAELKKLKEEGEEE